MTSEVSSAELVTAPHFRPSFLGRAFWKLRNALWEMRLNVRTGGAMHWNPALPDSRYATMPYRAFFAMLEHLRPNEDDVVVDIGCGKGRFLACAARLPVRKVVGIEINEPLAAVARTNLERMRGRRALVDVITAPAQEVDVSHGTIFYLYDSFGPGILRAVLNNLRSAIDAGRQVRFVYASPRHEWVLRECGWLERYDAWQPRPELGANHPVSFWRSIAPVAAPERVGAESAVAYRKNHTANEVHLASAYAMRGMAANSG